MSDEELRRIVRRVVPYGTLLDDNQTWAPAVPADINEPPPPVSAEGTAACEVCRKQFPLASLNITAHGYRCAGCGADAVVHAVPAGDLDNVKIGRGRWWLMPIVFAVGGAFVFVAPAIALVSTLIVAGIVFRLFVRRGL